MKTTTTIKARSAIRALDNAWTWYETCPPTCARAGNLVYYVTLRTV